MSSNMSFDKLIDRSMTDSSRWRGRGATLALTIGDADFPIPEPVRQAILTRTEQGVLGYDTLPGALSELISARLQQRYGWRIKREWLVYMPNLVQGLNFACRGLTEPGQTVLSEAPVYYPFLQAPGNSSRQLVTLAAKLNRGRWELDFDALEQAAGRADLFLLCNPQNPLGRVLSATELARVAEICMANDLVVCSDEIHCDLIYDDHRHIPFAAISPEVAEQTVTLMSPSKAFALSGLGGAFAIISSQRLREKFQAVSAGLIPNMNSYSQVAMMAAYAECDDWLEQQLDYLTASRDYLVTALAQMQGVRVVKPEATYFLWLDMRETGLNDPFQTLLDAGVELSDGEKFGMKGFLRLNFASPKSRLEEAVSRMSTVLSR